MIALTMLALLAHADELDPPPTWFVQGRGLYATSPVYAADAQSYAFDLGVRFGSDNMLAIRTVVAPDPIDVYGINTPDIAYGPVLVWAYDGGESWFHVVPTASIGLLWGDNPVSPETEFLGYLQGGLAFRVAIPLPTGGEVMMGPELGFVPMLVAPYAALGITYFGRAQEEEEAYPEPDTATAVPAPPAVVAAPAPSTPVVVEEPAVGARVRLTLEPSELTWDDAARTVTFAPGANVQSATYTEYVLDIPSLEAVLGGRPTRPVTVLVDIDSGSVSTVPAGPTTPQPEGGIRITSWVGRVVGTPAP